jgi:hypothetical protein
MAYFRSVADASAHTVTEKLPVQGSGAGKPISQVRAAPGPPGIRRSEQTISGPRGCPRSSGRCLERHRDGGVEEAAEAVRLSGDGLFVGGSQLAEGRDRDLDTGALAFMGPDAAG